MAGIEKYSNLMFVNDDEDQLDQIEAYSHYDYPSLPRDGYSSEHKFKYVSSDRDLSLPLQKHKNLPLYESPEQEISVRRYLGISVGLVSLIAENLLSHPFVVLRRQCQVHHSSEKYHLQPFTLIPTIIHLHQRQGVTTLWKGLGSCLLVRGMSLAVEDAIAKFTPWPKEVHNRTTLKQFGQHVLLKCVSIAVVMPFYSASLVETVQSDIASEKPGIFDVFREGANRLLAWRIPQKGRMLPFWAIVGPSVSLGISKYIFGLIVKGITCRIIRYRHKDYQESKGARCRDETTLNQNIEIYSTIISIFSSEIVFYPFETILHRLQLQGTRTIIDNLDNGYSVVPILTNYEGAIDCYKTTIATEGIPGLYKGFGALLLQFTAHIAVIKITKWIVTQITEILSTKPPTKIVEYYNLQSSNNIAGGGSSTIGIGVGDIHNSQSSTTISHSLSSLDNNE